VDSHSSTPLWRTLVVCVLVCASALLLAAGGTLVYAQRELLDSGRFADRLASALRDHDVRAVFARRVTAAIEAGRPDLIAARPVIRAAAMRVAGSAPFEAAVRSAAFELHRSVFGGGGRGGATLRVADAGVLIVDVVRRAHPALASRLQASVETRVASLASLHDSATSFARRVKRLASAGPWALVLAALLMAGALLLARDRRRGVVAVALSFAAAGGVGALALVVARAVVLSRVPGGDQDRAAAGDGWDAYLGGLLGWCLAALGAGLIVAAAAAVWARRGASSSPGERPRRAPRVLLVLVAAGLVAVAVLATRSAATPDGVSLGGLACNGHRELCGRRLDMVALAATHNSMAAASDPGWFFAQQQKGIAAQLDDGIRGLLIDTHYGVRTPRGIKTDLAAEGSTRAKLVAAVGEPFVAAAERLRGRIGYKGSGPPSVFLCHGACEVGATPVVPALEAVRDFAVRHPREVIVLSIEDKVTPADTVDAFRRSGLLPLVYTGPSGPPWPTLGSLVDSGHRIVVFGEKETGDVPWYRPQFKYVQDTPFGFRSVADLEAPSSCAPNRGPGDAALFLLNHWVDTPPANRPSNAAVVNRYGALLGRARRCEQERRRLPNLLAVDFYKTGDVLRVADALNGVGPAP
jgi:hypothetical protein